MESRKAPLMISNIAILIIFAYSLFKANLEFYNISWGTGVWMAGFSLKWGVAYLFFTALSILAWSVAAWILLMRPNWNWTVRLSGMRDRLGYFRWLFVFLAAVFPVWLLQYTSWGVVFEGIYLRLLIWALSVLAGSFLLVFERERILTYSSVLAAIIITGVIITLMVPLANVTNYPFSLGWSEGNRMWDYSLLFGKDLYIYDRQPSAYIDIGRQLIGGLPFLFSNITIFQERLWIAWMAIIPYVLLGLLAFQAPKRDPKYPLLLAGLWACIFVYQGPIHTPLLWSAILVALAWRRPLSFGVPLLLISAYIAQASRLTWIFAPAIWAAMLELGGAIVEQDQIQKRDWVRAISLGLAGLFGGYFAPKLIALLKGGILENVGAGVSPAVISSAVTNQPLLWYRLFPNATYGNGILLSLLFAVGPILAVLLYLSVTKRWALNAWQKIAILFPLLAFFVVGLVVSTKIGGGGDLHNMDMFIIGVMFTAALAWRAVGAEWLGSIPASRIWIRWTVFLLLVLPVLTPLRNLYPISFAADTKWLVTLTDVRSARDFNSLPPEEVISSSLEVIKAEVRKAQTSGEVLFLDQRQLLTFGFIQNMKLVPDYEKKRMMDEALSSDKMYFDKLYVDLSVHRFSLIVSEPLRTPIKDSSYQFGEENNAWVTWVAAPILCYYEPYETLKEVNVQLLAPKEEAADCAGGSP